MTEATRKVLHTALRAAAGHGPIVLIDRTAIGGLRHWGPTPGYG